jgi:hypothetical protein
MRARKRTLLVVVGLLLVLTAIPGTLTWRAWRQAQLNRNLLVAIRKNDVQATASLLSEGADANAHVTPVPLNLWQLFLNTFQRHSSSEIADATPLMYVFSVASTPGQYRAAAGRYQLPPEPVAMVHLLLQKGANPAGKYSDGSSLMLVPIAHRWTQCVQLMLAAGADANATDKYGFPVMRTALLLKDTDTVQTLMKYHAAVNWKDTAGKTPMQYAMELHDNKMLLLLKQGGANQ